MWAQQCTPLAPPPPLLLTTDRAPLTLRHRLSPAFYTPQPQPQPRLPQGRLSVLELVVSRGHARLLLHCAPLRLLIAHKWACCARYVGAAQAAWLLLLLALHLVATLLAPLPASSDPRFAWPDCSDSAAVSAATSASADAWWRRLWQGDDDEASASLGAHVALLLLLALRGLLLLASPAWRLRCAAAPRRPQQGAQQGCCERGCCEQGCCRCGWPRCLGTPSTDALLGAATAALALLSALLHPALLPWTALPARCDLRASLEGAWHLGLCVSAVALLLRLLLLLALVSASFGSVALRLGSAASLKLLLPFAALALALGAGFSLPLWSAAHDPAGEQAAAGAADAAGAEGAVSDLFASFPGAALQLLLLASGGGLGSGDTWLAMQRGTQPVGAAHLAPLTDPIHPPTLVHSSHALRPLTHP